MQQETNGLLGLVIGDLMTFAAESGFHNAFCGLVVVWEAGIDLVVHEALRL